MNVAEMGGAGRIWVRPALSTIGSAMVENSGSWLPDPMAVFLNSNHWRPNQRWDEAKELAPAKPPKKVVSSPESRNLG